MPDVSSAASPRVGSPLKHVVGIGASAGGLEALEQMFLEMPSDTGMAFVVVQHLSPDFASMMDELLVRKTDMPVQTVSDGMARRAKLHLPDSAQEGDDHFGWQIAVDG